MSREPVVGGTPFFHIFPVDQNGWKIHEFTKPAIYISTLWKYGPDACDQVVVMAITGRCVSSSFPNESNGLRMRPWLFVFFWTPLLYKLETRFWILCGVFSRMSHDRFILAYDTCNDKHCFTFTGFIDGRWHCARCTVAAVLKKSVLHTPTGWDPETVRLGPVLEVSTRILGFHNLVI